MPESFPSTQMISFGTVEVRMATTAFVSFLCTTPSTRILRVVVSLNAIIVSYLQKRQSRAVTRFPLIAPHG